MIKPTSNSCENCKPQNSRANPSTKIKAKGSTVNRRHQKSIKNKMLPTMKRCKGVIRIFLSRVGKN
jgi:hypothetical protein